MDPTPFVPSEAWIEAFTKQCTDDLRLQTQRYASRRAVGVQRMGGYVGSDYAHEMVQDVLADTLFGVLTWDHVATPLVQHVLDTIRSRTRHDRERAQSIKHQRIDGLEGAEAQRIDGELEASLMLDHDDPNPQASTLARDAVAKMRSAAGDHLDVLRFIDAIEAGATSRTEIMECAKLSLKAYRNARNRLRRIVVQLDDETGAALRRA